MKKPLTIIVGLIVIIFILAILFTQGSDSSPTPQNTSSTTSQKTTTGTSHLTEAEGLLGISLPSDSNIPNIINNNQAVILSGTTNLSITKARDFFAAQMSSAGYDAVRKWGVSPLDSTTIQSASFRGNGENWAINLRTDGNTTNFDIQRQY